MNLFDAVIGNQYYELVKTGRDGSKALFNGNLLNSACILLLLLTLFNLTVLNGAASKNFFEELGTRFGERSGKGLGELLAIPLFAIIYFFVKSTVGTKSRFQRLTERFDSMGEQEKKAVFRRGAIFVFTCLGLFLVTFFVS